MSTSSVGHLQFNISAGNVGFYRSLLTPLGFEMFPESDHYVAAADSNGVSLWFMVTDTEAAQDHDHRGMNHLAFSADSVESVDQTASFLGELGVEALFETPRRRPDFIGEGDTDYYQVMFRSPDGELFEVVYTGPLAEEYRVMLADTTGN